MSKEDGSGMSRRNLLKTLAVGGAAASTIGLSGCLNGGEQQAAKTKFACPYCDKEFESQTKLVEHIQETHPQEISDIQKSGVITWNEEKCFGGERCVLACSTSNKGKVATHLSSIQWNEDYLSGYEREPLLCKQCDSPECFYACPIEDAMYIDEETGARCVNEEECTGCGECVDACPFDPPRIRLGPNEETAIKCDLCSDRIKEGKEPVCVEICSKCGEGKALKYVPREER